MKPIDRSEILSIGDYEPVRPRFRDRVIAEKKLRRARVGEHISVLFENRDTVLLQIQEMVRTERMTSEPAIAHEIETYNELIPGPHQLSLTLMIEIADKEQREKTLEEWAGLEKTVALEIDGRSFPVHGKFAGVIEGRTTAVHYFKVDLDDAAEKSVRAKTAKAAIVVSHPKVDLRAELPKETVARLAEDLAS